MYRHNLTVDSRHLFRGKGYSIISTLGLAVGMGVCLTIAQYIYVEWSYDTFHHQYQHMYQVMIEEEKVDSKDAAPYVGYALGVQAQEELDEVEQYVRQGRFNRGAIVTNLLTKQVFYEEPNNLLLVDLSFFQVFNFLLIQGNPESLFTDKYSLVITEWTALKLFGSDDPIGKRLTIRGPPSPGEYTVTGVIQEPPLNSPFQFDYLFPMENYLEYGWGGAVKEQGGWSGFTVVTYLTLEESADLAFVQEKLDQLLARYRETEMRQKVILQPIVAVYSKSGRYTDAGFLTTYGNEQSIQFFSIISLFTLFISWINYINLRLGRCDEPKR